MLVIDSLQIRADPFNGPALLDGLSLKVEPGEAVGVVGRSGCGKTTLLRTIAGLIDPMGGAVTLDGKSPGELGWPMFRRRVSLVPQRPVVRDESVAGNLERAFLFHAVHDAFDADLARRMLDVVELAHMWDTQAPSLSEGESQRVCLVRSLLLRPDVLLLDEPTSALDVESVGLVETLLIQAMSEYNLGILIATHDRHQAARLYSQVIDLAQFMSHRQGVVDA